MTDYAAQLFSGSGMSIKNPLNSWLFRAGSTRDEHGTTVTNNLGLFEASKALGHAGIQTTIRDAKSDDDALKKIQEISAC